MVIRYRFGDHMPISISVKRYGRLIRRLMEPIWITAIRRLMATKGVSQATLSEDSSVRPNTISDVLNDTNPTDARLSTMGALATGLGVPLWALFCTEREYVLFTDQLKQDDAELVAAKQRAAMRAEILAAFEPIAEALLTKLTGQSVDQPANPLPAQRPKLAHSSGKAQSRKKSARR